MGRDTLYFQAAEAVIVTVKGYTNKLAKYIGYSMSAVFFFGGLFVIFGVYFRRNFPEQFRVTLGIVLILWGIYRYVITLTKAKQDDDQ